MKSARGFTLLEVLVALVLIGLLMVVLFGGFRAGINSWRIADQHSMRVEEPRQLSGLLYRHLGQLLPARFAADEQGNIQPSFTGEKGRMLYIAPPINVIWKCALRFRVDQPLARTPRNMGAVCTLPPQQIRARTAQRR